MTQVAIVGCGVIGAAIAYELSSVPGLQVTVFDRQPPARAATGSALGVLMGAISQKTKGKAWQLRQMSLQRYETLIPELQAITGATIPFNRHGIVMLCFDPDELESWQKLAQVRQEQGWPLQIWDAAEMHIRCPQLADAITAAIYSPCDRQLNPTALTLTLVKAAQMQGVTFDFETHVMKLATDADSSSGQERCSPQLQTSRGLLTTDWIVIAAGLGATELTQAAPQPLDIRPVLGQALRLKLPHPLGAASFQPVITGHDIHIVPLGQDECWVGATVEFPNETGAIAAQPHLLHDVLQGAIAFCPPLVQGAIVQTWSGLRPRPFNRPAPIIEPLPGFNNVLVATGHYRNGVLLAPATALLVKERIVKDIGIY
jgi:glycine/D-amino acid oxidase-like deaminating enzyme